MFLQKPQTGMGLTQPPVQPVLVFLFLGLKTADV
jgi:hypothetical protein